MAAVDLETQIYTRIWDILNGSADWKTLIPIGNQIRYDQIQGMQTAVKDTTADGDYPQAELWIRSGRTSLYTFDETFGTYSDEPPPKWMEQHEYVYRLQLKSDLQAISIPDKLGAESRKSLRLAGPRLGLSFVSRVVLAWSTSESDRDTNDGVHRWVTNIDISLQLQIDGSTL